MRNASVIPPQSPASSLTVPPGHIGPLTIPGSGRRVWWTGRVAIGLRHEPKPAHPFDIDPIQIDPIDSAVAHSSPGATSLTLDDNA